MSSSIDKPSAASDDHDRDLDQPTQNKPPVRYQVPDPCPVEDLEAILQRAQHAGIDPWRVIVALGLPHESFEADHR